MADARVIVDATGASNGVTFGQLLARGMRPIVQVNATGVETATSTSLDVLRSRGLAAFCQVDQTGVDPVSGATAQQLAQRGILALCPIDSSGIAQNGTLTEAQLEQRGLRPFLPTDETGAPKIIGGIILSNSTIAENSANGTTLGTASVPATYTGTPTWSLTDVSGTFQINSSTGVITVLSNTALNYEVNTSLPITISVSGMTPSVPNYLVSIVITNVIETPVNTVAPVISGGTSIGSVLSITSSGTWTDMQSGSFSSQWNNGADISGATASTYTVQAGDSGDNIICKVTATNSASSATANSNSIGPIAGGGTGPSPPTLALVSISDSGSSNSDNITNVSSPFIDITFPTTPVAGDVVTIKDGATVIATHTLTSGDIVGSTVDLGLSALSDGVHSLTAQHTQSGVPSGYGSSLSVTIDTTAPTLSSPSGAGDGTVSNQADLSVTTNEGSGTLYWVISTSATPPSAAQIIAGNDSSGSAAYKSGNLAVSSTGTKTPTAGSMTNGTYYAYFVQTDVAGNNSSVAASSSWTQVVTSGPVLTYQGRTFLGNGSASPATFASCPIGTASANRMVIACIMSGASYDAPVTAVTIGGVSATISTNKGTGASTGSFSGQITWAWAVVPTGTTANVVMTGGINSGDGAVSCFTYTFDTSLKANSAPTTAFHNATAATSNTVTLNTSANGFIITCNQCDYLSSESAWSITSSTETYATDYSTVSGSQPRQLIASKTNGSAANSPTSVTFGWTTSGQSFASILAWN